MRTHRLASSRLLLLVGILATLALASLAHAQAAPVQSAPRPEPPLPKACWPASQLRGADTAYFYLPCRDRRMLDPGVRAQLECTERRMIEHGRWVINGKPSLRVGETQRSDERQRRLHDQGRGRPGVIVTYAKTASQSAHGKGFAFDVYHARDGYANERFYKSFAGHADACGLEAGYYWRRLKDGPHAESRTWRKSA